MSEDQSNARQRRRATIGLAALYAAIYFSIGVRTPYFPVWLAWKELTPGQIAVVASAPLLARVLLTTLIAVGADLTGNRRLVTIVFAWVSVALLAALNLASGFAMLLTLSFFLVITTRTILPLAEAITVFEVHQQKRDYGRIRLWGSISFAVASMAAGLAVQWRGKGSIIPLLIAAGVLTAISVHCVPPAKNCESGSPTKTPFPTVSEVFRTVTSRRILAFLLTCACVQGSHAMFYTYGMIHWGARGLSPVASSALWNVGVASEILVFWQSRVFLSRFGAAKLLTIAAAAGVVRWTAMGLEPPLLLLPVLQLLHGLTYGATQVAAMKLIPEMVAARLGGTMQAIYTNATSGIAIAFATLLAGHFYPTLKCSAYFTMAALALFGGVAGICLIRIESPASTPHPLTIVPGQLTRD